MITFTSALALVLAVPGLPAKNVDQAQLKCLSEAIYFEAGNQTPLGKIAVANVILNRQKSNKKGLDVCGIIKQPKQFSYFQMTAYKKQRIDFKNPNVAKAVAESVIIAQKALEKKLPDVTRGARFYINPVYATSGNWTKSFIMTAKVGDHYFYRDPKVALT